MVVIGLNGSKMTAYKNLPFPAWKDGLKDLWN